MTLGPSARPIVAPNVVKMPLREPSDGGLAVCMRSPRSAILFVLRQSEHEQLIAQPRLQVRRQADETEREPRAARADGDVLLAVGGEGDRIAVDGRAEIDLPEHVARALVVGAESAVDVAAEQQ